METNSSKISCSPHTLSKPKVFLALATKFESICQNDKTYLPSSEKNRIKEIIKNQLPNSEVTKFNELLVNIENISNNEKELWRKNIFLEIGNEKSLIDDCVHNSHIHKALEDETPAIKKIILGMLCSSHHQNTDFAKKLRAGVFGQFSKQFISFAEISPFSDFDRLSLKNLKRLKTYLGGKEIALASRGLENIELLNTLLRRFAVENQRQIFLHINHLQQKIPQSERVKLAEQLVKTCLEIKTPLLLDKLGEWLIQMTLLEGKRKMYYQQKFPINHDFTIPNEILSIFTHVTSGLKKILTEEVQESVKFLENYKMKN